jgi:hypothetical protein
MDDIKGYGIGFIPVLHTNRIRASVRSSFSVLTHKHVDVSNHDSLLIGCSLDGCEEWLLSSSLKFNSNNKYVI